MGCQQSTLESNPIDKTLKPPKEWKVKTKYDNIANDWKLSDSEKQKHYDELFQILQSPEHKPRGEQPDHSDSQEYDAELTSHLLRILAKMHYFGWTQYDGNKFNGDDDDEERNVQCKTYCEKALELFPHNSAAMILMGRSLKYAPYHQYEEALEWFRKAAEIGDADAMFAYGNELYDDERKKAVKWLDKGASMKHVDCMLKLVDHYEERPRLMKKYLIMAVECGSTEAMKKLAYEYIYSERQSDIDRGLKYMMDAAKQNDVDACMKLGTYLCSGLEHGIERDWESGFFYFKKAADLGQVDAMYKLARWYRIGRLLPMDREQAFSLLSKSFGVSFSYIDEEDDDRDAEELAWCYYLGDGVEKDLDKAVEYMRHVPTFCKDAGLEDATRSSVEREPNLSNAKRDAILEEMEKYVKEYDKFKSVEDLLQSVDQYMSIYAKLQENNGIVSVGSFGDKAPMHEIPKRLQSIVEWNQLDVESQFAATKQQAIDTMAPNKELLQYLSNRFDVECSEGPLKADDRVQVKRDQDYDGDVRRVIDFVRGSILISKKLEVAKKIVDSFKEGGSSYEVGWELVRCKDGFAKPENFLSGGYRDIKLNVRYRETGHITEIQLHLQEYYDLKKAGGHKHYEFSRQLKVDGVTNAVQILSLPPNRLAKIGEFELGKVGKLMRELGTKDTDAAEYTMLQIERARTLKRLGDLYMMDSDPIRLKATTIEALQLFYEALQILRSCACSAMFQRAEQLLLCQAMISTAALLPRIQPKMDSYYVSENYNGEEWINEDAQKLLDLAVETSENTLGALHPFTLEACKTRALQWSGLTEKEEYDSGDDSDAAITEAKQHIETIIASQVAVLGKDHPSVVLTKLDLGKLIIRKNQGNTQGMEMIVDALEAALKRLGFLHPTTDRAADATEQLWKIVNLFEPNVIIRDRIQVIYDEAQRISDCPLHKYPEGWKKLHAIINTKDRDLGMRTFRSW